MSHVFISYSREEDQPYARKLADELRKHDIEVWLETMSITAPDGGERL